MSVRFVERGSCLGNAVSLSKREIIVDDGRGKHRFEPGFFRLQGCVELDEFQAALQVSLRQPVNLIWGKADRRDQIRIEPELSGRQAQFVQVLHFIAHLFPFIGTAFHVGAVISRMMHPGLTVILCGRWTLLSEERGGTEQQRCCEGEAKYHVVLLLVKCGSLTH